MAMEEVPGGTPPEKRKRGRPRVTDPDLAKARLTVLQRVRNRALYILASRHPDEFVEIKNTLLVKAGHPPIDPSFAVREAEVTVDTPLNLGESVWKQAGERRE